MTDDSTMDKKNYGFLPSKCTVGQSGQDTSRPRQDGSGGNQVARNFPKTTSRRRDSPNSNPNAVKTRSEATPVRKPIPQKSKAMDKRPRARHVNNDQSVEEESKKGPELGSLQTPGSKKQSFNHLLNFHFAPRENRTVLNGSWRSYNTHPGGGWRSRHGSGACGSRPKFNKENFLQANCQFLVKANGDYSAQLYNPDLLVEWDVIEQIYIRVSGEFPNCPICLSPPVAAKMTRCGHIFCWPCLLHYLALSDRTCRKCPICFEPVYKHELKSVVVTNCEDVHIGDEIEMQLMFRKKGVFKAMPLMCKDRQTFEWESIFSKLLEASPSEVKVRVLDREKKELEQRFEEEKHTPEVCFVEQAMRELDTRLSNTVESSSEVVKLAGVFSALNLPGLDPNIVREECENGNAELGNFEQFDCSSQITQQEVVKELPVSRQRTESAGSESVGTATSDDDMLASKYLGGEDFFYFYQAVKGENIFLHPINMAMLWKSFGPNPAMWPQVIQFKVIDSEYVIMMEDMRKRLKFLQHLPLTTNVQLVEVDLKPPVIAEEVLAEFSHQLEARRKRRNQRARDERRRERKFEEEERRRLRGPKFEFEHDFPEYHFEEDCAVSTQSYDSNSTDVAGMSVTEEDTSMVDRNSNVQVNELSSSPSGMSFAQIVCQKSASQSSMRAGGAWGVTPPTASASPQSRSRFHSDGEGDPDEYAVPAYRISMSDAIARAIANVNTVDGDPTSATGPGKKKGRKKGKVLFATGMGCLQ